MIHIAINFEDDFDGLCFLKTILSMKDTECEVVWKDPETDGVCFGIYKKGDVEEVDSCDD